MHLLWRRWSRSPCRHIRYRADGVVCMQAKPVRAMHWTRNIPCVHAIQAPTSGPVGASHVVKGVIQRCPCVPQVKANVPLFLRCTFHSSTRVPVAPSMNGASCACWIGWVQGLSRHTLRIRDRLSRPRRQRSIWDLVRRHHKGVEPDDMWLLCVFYHRYLRFRRPEVRTKEDARHPTRPERIAMARGLDERVADQASRRRCRWNPSPSCVDSSKASNGRSLSVAWKIRLSGI